jgi:hypothetical protein
MTIILYAWLAKGVTLTSCSIWLNSVVLPNVDDVSHVLTESIMIASEHDHINVVGYLLSIGHDAAYTRAVFDVTDVCSVCLDEPIRPLLLGCKHVFCVDCIDTTRITKCPVCSTPIVRSKCREHG